MAKQTSKDQLLKDIHTERSRLENLLFMLNQDEMEESGVTGEWSVKDILAHLIAWEQLLLAWYQSGLQGQSPIERPVGMSRKMIDELNQEIYEKNKERPLDAILAEFRASYEQVLTMIKAIPEEDLFARGRYKWTESLTLADYVAGNTCNHYAWAKAQIRKRVKRELD